MIRSVLPPILYLKKYILNELEIWNANISVPYAISTHKRALFFVITENVSFKENPFFSVFAFFAAGSYTSTFFTDIADKIKITALTAPKITVNLNHADALSCPPNLSRIGNAHADTTKDAIDPNAWKIAWILVLFAISFVRIAGSASCGIWTIVHARE